MMFGGLYRKKKVDASLGLRFSVLQSRKVLEAWEKVACKRSSLPESLREGSSCRLRSLGFRV